MGEKYVALSAVKKKINYLVRAYRLEHFKEKIAEALKRVPIEDVAPVVHGHWEETDETVWDEEEECLVPLIKCSVCSTREREDEDCPYCRRCGAKMDEQEDNQ